MGSGTPAWPRTNCPHLAGGLTDFETAHPGVGAGSNVVVTGRVLLKACSLADPAAVINRITIRDGAELVIDDSDVVLNVREILVEAGGALLAGSSTCRRYGSLHITFHGTRASSSLVNFAGPPSKGLLSRGTVDLHGKQYHPTWTRLARPAVAGTRLIYLQDPVNWEVGQEIVLTTTTIFDCPAEWQDEFCRPCFFWEYCESIPHQNEVLTITGLSMDAGTHEYVIQVSSDLQYTHYAGPEYQPEVALLSRRIVLEGTREDDVSVGFGGHTLVTAPGVGRFSGVQMEEMGQLNVEARYPFHFHEMGTSGSDSYVEDCSVTNSHFRGYVVHGTDNSRFSRNTAYNVKGMCYYLEDGVEEENLFEYNFAGHIHPIHRPANGGIQGGETFVQSSSLFNPADTSASGFYIPNAYNDFYGNAVSGGWSGFAFPNTPRPLGLYRGTDRGNLNPEHRPVLRFEGNTAHSTGFYWQDSGSAFYVGADLAYEGGSGPLRYMSGRHERHTLNPDGSNAWMRFRKNKAFLTNIGFAHWGSRVELYEFEAQDVHKGAMLFGEAAMDNALIVARTPNSAAWSVFDTARYNYMGFQFYDTWVKTILSRVTFRGFKANPASGRSDYAVSYMTHSDQFTPQCLNSVRGLRFEDCDESIIIHLGNCGPDCGGSRSTMSSRIYSVLDWDGSFSLTGQPSIVASNEEWWNLGGSAGCTFRADWGIWLCPWRTNMHTAFIEPKTADLYNGCDYGLTSGCTGQTADYTVGTMELWGRPSSAIPLSPWAGTVGHANTGWHWRVFSDLHGVNGAPSRIRIGDYMNVAPGTFVVLSIRYPAATTFRVYLEAMWWGVTMSDLPMSSKATVLTPTEDLGTTATCDGPDTQFCTNTGGIGPAWHFDGTHLFLRIVNPECYHRRGRDSCQSDGWYEFEGLRVWDIYQMFSYYVEAECSGCPVQSSRNGVNFYTVPDQNSPPTFNGNYGAVRTDTSGGPPGNANSQTCPPPTGGTPSCPAIPSGGSGVNSYTTSCSTTTTTTGGTCTLTCDTPGYSGSATRTCNAGSWSPQIPSCSGATCGSIPAGGSGTNTYTTSCASGTTPSGGTCTLTCNTPGYSGSVTRTCDSGSWTSQTPACSGAQCPPIPDGGSGTNSYTTTCGSSNVNSGSTCTLTCSTSGYSGSATRTCSAGTWTTQTPSCSAVPCNAIPPGGAGTQSYSSTCSSGTTTSGGTCTLTCNTAGYTGSSTRTCTSGSWSGSAPTCTAQPCSSIPNGGSGTGSYTSSCSSGSTPHGSSCTLTCNTPSYSGSATRTCTAGSWSTQPVTCYADGCAAIPEGGSGTQAYTTDCRFSSTASGGTCALRCTATGYSGTATRTCSAGSWSTQTPTCVPDTCSQEPSGAGMQSSCSGDSTYGETCSWTCRSGYSGSGTVRTCGADGVWTGPQATCTASGGFQCTNAPASPSGGYVWFDDGNNHGSVGRFECYEGYRRVGAASVTCNAPSGNAMWPTLDPVPTCVPTQCTNPPSAPANGQVSFSAGNSHESVATFSCNSGFALSGGETIMCSARTSDASWPAASATCTSTAWECHFPPSSPPGGYVTISDGNRHGSVASFFCYEGNTLRGSQTITCSATEQWAQWPVPDAECIEPCSSPPMPPANGHVEFSDGQLDGSVASFTCESGFELVGETYVECSVETGGETWPAPSAECRERIYLCTSPPGAPASGSVTFSAGDLHDSVATFSCDDGLTLLGDTSVTCSALLSDSNWPLPSVTPTCEDVCSSVVCPEPDQCHDASTCDPTTGTCVPAPRPDGTPCDDGNAITINDICVRGRCAGYDNSLCAGVTCAPATECAGAETCDYNTGSCVAGDAVEDGSVCSGGSCSAGECVAEDGIVAGDEGSEEAAEGPLTGAALYGVIAAASCCCCVVIFGVVFLAIRSRDSDDMSAYDAYELKDPNNPTASQDISHRF